MTDDRETELSATTGPGQTVVWIDSEEAVVVRWREGAANVERLESDVPPHHRSTGNVRHQPSIRHGGGGAPQSAEEPHRHEHLERFVQSVLRTLPEVDDVDVVGPGRVHEQLAMRLRDDDRRHARRRVVSTEASGPMTEPQLIARARARAGEAPRRRQVGRNGA